ncbi:hypothetical protein [Sphingomonas bacterium]|uniref:hypothetical protein n=1 Tax=Sphingomonas bacterium TaxID=1895847 RepID=UPI001576EC76|nr:hypothetical protein [Sphingomonas bacterium]
MTEAVGIFWMVDDVLVAAGCELEHAAPYGDCLTYDGGHAEHWEQWQQAGGHWLNANGLPAAILTSEYDEHPRGRIVKDPGGFVLYADRRLQTPARIAAVCERFGLEVGSTSIRSDSHYRERLS